MEAYLDGASARDVAAKFGVSESTVRRWLAQAGAPLRSRGAPRIDDTPDEDLLRMRREGMTVEAIARRLGMTKSGAERRITAARAATAAAEGARLSDIELVTARERGASWRELALRAGQPVSTVRARALRAQAREAGHG